ncbi:MAG: DNA starvation/stationary phase protection protein [Planctomycetota bacterium]
MTGSSFRSPVSAEIADRLAAELQPLVLDLIDLSLQLKHAHWNLRGAVFVPLHEQLDGLHESVLGAADALAERQVMIGHAVDGLARSFTERSRLNPLPVRFLPSQEVIEDISNRLARVIELLRHGIEITGALDPITQDLLIGTTAGLEKHLWMLQAQQL